MPTLRHTFVAACLVLLSACGGSGGGSDNSPQTPGNDPGSNPGGGNEPPVARSVTLPSVTLSGQSVTVKALLGDSDDPVSQLQVSIINVANWEPVCAVNTGITDLGGGQLGIDTACVSDLNIVAVTGATLSNGVALVHPHRGIFTRNQLMDGTANVTALSDTVYAQVAYLAAANYDSALILTTMNRSASQLLASDINGSGVIDSDDVARWQPSLGQASLARQIQVTHKLSNRTPDLAGSPYSDFVISKFLPEGFSPKITAIDSSGTAVYAADWSSRKVYVYDVASPTSPILTETLTLGSVVNTTIIEQGRLYVADGSGISVFDLTDPLHPALLGKATVSASTALRMVGTIAFAASSSNVKIVDLTDPVAPVEIGKFTLNGSGDQIRDLAVAGSNLFLNTGKRFLIVDIANPAAPQLLSERTLFSKDGTFASPIAVMGSAAYVGDELGIHVFNIADATNPSDVKTLSEFAKGGAVPNYSPNWVGAIRAAGNRLYVAGGAEGILTLDISNQLDPKVLSRIALPGNSGANQIVENAGKLFVAGGLEGVFLVQPERVDDSVLARTALPGAVSLDVKGTTLVVASGSAKVVEGKLVSTSIVQTLDIANADAPTFTGTAHDAGAVTNRLRVAGNFAYLSGPEGAKRMDIETSNFFDVSGIQAVYSAMSCTTTQCVFADYDINTQTAKLQRLSKQLPDGTFQDSDFTIIDVDPPFNAPSAVLSDDNFAIVSTLTSSFIADLSKKPLQLISVGNRSADSLAKNATNVVSTNAGWGTFSVDGISPEKTLTSLSETGLAGFSPQNVAMEGNIVYLLDRRRGVMAFDIVDPKHPQFIGQIRTSGANDIKLLNDRVVVADILGLSIARKARSLPAVAN